MQCTFQELDFFSSSSMGSTALHCTAARQEVLHKVLSTLVSSLHLSTEAQPCLSSMSMQIASGTLLEPRLTLLCLQSTWQAPAEGSQQQPLLLRCPCQGSRLSSAGLPLLQLAARPSLQLQQPPLQRSQPTWQQPRQNHERSPAIAACRSGWLIYKGYNSASGTAGATHSNAQLSPGCKKTEPTEAGQEKGWTAQAAAEGSALLAMTDRCSSSTKSDSPCW